MRPRPRPALLLLLLLLRLLHSSAANFSQPNVLFIIVEDLRVEPWFGPDVPASLTALLVPNIQRIASRGVSFLRAYCQVAVCAPSRTSILTGLRPDTLGIYDFSHYGGTRYFRTIPSHLHRQGYQTSSSGKLHHWDSHRYYSTSYWGHPRWDEVQRRESRWQNSSVTPDAFHNDPLAFYRDAHVLREALRSLRTMQARREAAEAAASAPAPWFLAVGFKGTHLPYHVPKRFHDLIANVSFRAPPGALTFPPSAPLLHHVRKTVREHPPFTSSPFIPLHPLRNKK